MSQTHIIAIDELVNRFLKLAAGRTDIHRIDPDKWEIAGQTFTDEQIDSACKTKSWNAFTDDLYMNKDVVSAAALDGFSPYIFDIWLKKVQTPAPRRSDPLDLFLSQVQKQPSKDDFIEALKKEAKKMIARLWLVGDGQKGHQKIPFPTNPEALMFARAEPTYRGGAKQIEWSIWYNFPHKNVGAFKTWSGPSDNHGMMPWPDSNDMTRAIDSEIDGQDWDVIYQSLEEEVARHA